MHSVVCAILAKEDKPQFRPPPHQDDHTDTNNPGSSSAKAFCGRIADGVHLRILRDFAFWIVCICTSGLRLVDGAWLVFYVPHLQAKGFSPQVSAALATAAGVGYFFGTLIFAPFVDKGRLKCSTAVMMSSLTLTVSLMVDPVVNSIVGMAVITFLYGLSTSAMYTLTDVLTKELLGYERLTSGFSWIGAISLGARLLAGFLPGKVNVK